MLRYNSKKTELTSVSCVVCGNEFKPTHRHNVICSATCRQKQQSQYNKTYRQAMINAPEAPKKITFNMKVRNCIVCGGAYFPVSNVQKTCSVGCRTILRHNYQNTYQQGIKKARVITEKHCSKCGDYFKPMHNQQTICSTCKTKKPVNRTCIECGTQFTYQGKGTKLVCSDACSTNRQRHQRETYGIIRVPSKPRTCTCHICGTPFTANKGSKYCSDACRQEAKNKQARQLRSAIPAEIRLKPLVKKTCRHCGIEIMAGSKVKYCSDACRLEVKRIGSRKLRQKAKAKTEPAIHYTRKLNKRKPKAEKDLAYAMLELNRAAPKNDREIIDLKNIESPDLSKIEFKAYDKRLRITRFFRSEDRYNEFLNEQKTQTL